VTELGEATGERAPNITRTNDAYLHSEPFYAQ
jgi:hypothetical protein